MDKSSYFEKMLSLLRYRLSPDNQNLHPNYNFDHKLEFQNRNLDQNHSEPPLTSYNNAPITRDVHFPSLGGLNDNGLISSTQSTSENNYFSNAHSEGYDENCNGLNSVSYTHLTLPTKRIV